MNWLTMTLMIHWSQQDDDHDSAIGDDLTLSTSSLESSIMNYRLENGRTYHGYKDGSG
jgi:hypothetical protein